MSEKKETMIGQENRPTAIDYDQPIANFKLRDLYAVIQAHPEIIKVEKEVKPEQLKPEHYKVEKEYFKPEKEKEILKGEKEKEYFKPEKEYFKPEKEALKPEKEFSKPEKVFDRPDVIDAIANKVLEHLKASGKLK